MKEVKVVVTMGFWNDSIIDVKSFFNVDVIDIIVLLLNATLGDCFKGYFNYESCY
jgi:hypothetical protein